MTDLTESDQRYLLLYQEAEMREREVWYALFAAELRHSRCEWVDLAFAGKKAAEAADKAFGMLKAEGRLPR